MAALTTFTQQTITSKKNIFKLAKKSIKNSLATCQKKIALIGRRSTLKHELLVNVEDSPRMEHIFRKDIVSKKKTESQATVIIPFLMIRSDSRGNYELFCDHMEFLMEFVLVDVKGLKYLGDVITFQQESVQIVIKTIVSRVNGVKELLLDTMANSQIMQTIIDFYQVINDKVKKKFYLENLSLVGSTRINDIDVLSSLLMLSRRTLQSLRLRYCKVHSSEQAVRLWTSVAQCSKLHQIQYEPYKTDIYSRPYLVDALTSKKLSSLILTDIEGLSESDVIAMCNGGNLTELAVIAENVTPYLYSSQEAKKTISNLDSLLIQLNDEFDVNDCNKRAALVQVLKTLPSSALMEVIHSTKCGVQEASKIISYWLQLAQEAEKCIMLKLENCSQERQDAAVGRVLRKVKKSQKVACNENGIALSLANGQVVVLDKNIWFGDDY